MSSGMISIVKSMGWEAVDDSTPWTSSYSAGEKKGKKQSFSPFSWKMQEIWVPSLGNLSKTNWNHEHLWILHVKQCICTFPSSPSQQSFFGAVLPRLPLASLSLSFGEKKKKSLYKKPLWPIIWKSKWKGCWKRRKRNLHVQWNDFISHNGFKACSKFLSYFFGGLNFIHYLSQCKE